MRTQSYDCGCMVIRDDSGHPKDVARCASHKDYKDTERLVNLLNTPPVLDVKVVDGIHAKDRFGRR